MTYSGNVVRLVTRAGSYEKADAHGVGVVVALGDYLQAVVEDFTVEFHAIRAVGCWCQRCTLCAGI
jgi:hypothetical protein